MSNTYKHSDGRIIVTNNNGNTTPICDLKDVSIEKLLTNNAYNNYKGRASAMQRVKDTTIVYMHDMPLCIRGSGNVECLYCEKLPNGLDEDVVGALPKRIRTLYQLALFEDHMCVEETDDSYKHASPYDIVLDGDDKRNTINFRTK